MISITDKKNCCGCNACVQKCPKQCISMQEDPEGFLYPVVYREKCVGCGLCEKVCPILNIRVTEQEITAYAAYANDDDLRMRSSSGGMFTLFARQILGNDGVVFGASFDENFMVHHIGVESEEELYKLQGSKYLQSRIENTYREAEQYLKSGRRVLYTGTACQIAGLKQFLGKDYELLCTVDVLCHGVPSPKVWKRYFEYQENCHGGAMTQMSFRQKDTGWKTFSIKMQFSNLSEYEQTFSKDLFMQMFLSNICLRSSCHACKFKGLDRPSDITIGDSWGIENYMPEMDDDKGTSVVLCHTEKGKRLFEKCEDETVCRKAEVNKILPPSADSRKSVKMHAGRAAFFRKLRSGRSVQDLAKVLHPSLLRRIVRKLKRYMRKIIVR